MLRGLFDARLSRHEAAEFAADVEVISYRLDWL
jgi:hypothetical protein